LAAYNPSFKAVTFDLWNTLLFESDGESAKRSALRCQNVTQTLNKLGVNTTLEQATQAIDQTINKLLKIWDKNKDVTHLDQLQYLVRFASNGKLKLKKAWIPELSHAYTSSLFEIQPQLNPDTFTVLQWLRDQNKHMGIICNTGVTPGFLLRKFLTQRGAAEYFDHMIFSDEAHIRKPDPRIFHLAAMKLGTKPHNMIHIGDNLIMDVHGSKAAGYKAIHLADGQGHDRQAEKDPTSYIGRSSNVGTPITQPKPPDKTISSLAQAINAVKELETTSHT